MKDHLEFGYVSRTHGLKGEVMVRTYDPSSEVLDEVKTVAAIVRGDTSGKFRTLTIEDVRDGSKGDLLVAFAGVLSKASADALVGAKLFVVRSDLEAPKTGEYFQGDLVGLRAFDEAGVELGEVKELFEGGPVPNLVIVGAQGEQMIPFAEEFIVKVDLSARTIVVRPLEFME